MDAESMGSGDMAYDTRMMSRAMGKVSALRKAWIVIRLMDEGTGEMREKRERVPVGQIRRCVPEAAAGRIGVWINGLGEVVNGNVEEKVGEWVPRSG